MMVNTMDMSAPVTRGELREELDRSFDLRLAPLATKAELAQLATKVELAQLATKAELAQLATKAELAQLATKAELAQFATKADLEPLVTKEYLEERLKPLVTKEYLEERLKPLVTKEYLEERLKPLVTTEYFEKRLDERLASLATKEDLGAMKTELSKELAQHVKSMEETFRKQVSTFDDKYKDLPGRVHRLEGAVFPENEPGSRPDDKLASERESQTGRPDDKKARPEEKKAKARPSTPARSPKRR